MKKVFKLIILSAGNPYSVETKSDYPLPPVQRQIILKSVIQQQQQFCCVCLGHTLSFICGLYAACHGMTLVSH